MIRLLAAILYVAEIVPTTLWALAHHIDTVTAAEAGILWPLFWALYAIYGGR